MILRIFCNSSSLEDIEAKKKWLVEVAKIWWSSADPQIECNELDVLCADTSDNQNNQ